MARNLDVLADTSGIIALLDESDRHHLAAIEVFKPTFRTSNRHIEIFQQSNRTLRSFEQGIISII